MHIIYKYLLTAIVDASSIQWPPAAFVLTANEGWGFHHTIQHVEHHLLLP